MKVCTHLLSSINFCYTENACRLPKIRGILYFACGAQHTLFNMNSRIGSTSAYSTIYSTLRGLSDSEAQLTEALGRDPNSWLILCLDNVQSYTRRRDLRIGRVNQLRIGTAATAMEAEDFHPSAMDIDDRRTRIAENKRKDMTVPSLLALVDNTHADRIGTLQWLRILAHYVPELSGYKSKVSELYRTKGAKKQINPHRKTKVHPLATNAKNEAKTTELKDALLDFLSQMGQRDHDYLRKLVLAGGDGLTFEKLLQLKRYLQFHDDAFQSLELLVPILELWHLEWTDLSRIYEIHWGDHLSSDDPGTLRNSAAEIGRKEPANLSKVDYYPYMQLAYLVLDVRMLDCWR
jgi:hypothetical protein